MYNFESYRSGTCIQLSSFVLHCLIVNTVKKNQNIIIITCDLIVRAKKFIDCVHMK